MKRIIEPKVPTVPIAILPRLVSLTYLIVACLVCAEGQAVTINTQPKSQSAIPGSRVFLSVTASGSGLTYQWKKNTVNISGATSFFYTIESVVTDDAADYTVVVTDSGGSVTSQAAKLTVPTGMRAWWTPNEIKRDVLRGHDMTTYGGSFVSGRYGSAFHVDNGTYGSASASGSLDVGSGAGFTVETWIKPSSVSTLNQPIVEWNASGTIGVSFQLSGASTAGALYANVVDTSGNSHTIGPAGSVSSSQWSHVALTYFKLSGVATLYLNGNSVAQTLVGNFTPQTTYDFVMGARPGTGYKFEGEIDELAIYANALSSTEIANIATGFKTPLDTWLFSNWSDVAGWWATTTWDEESQPQSDPFLDWQHENNLDSYDASSSYIGMKGNAIALSSPLIQPSYAGVGVNRNGTLDGPLSSFSFECWLKPEDLNQLEQTIIEWNTGNANDPVWGIGVHFILSTTAWNGSQGGYGSLYANLIDTSGNSHQVITGPNLVAAHSFNHVALTWDNDTARIYLNGEQVAYGDFNSLSLRNDCAFYLGIRPDWAWAGEGEWGYYLPGLFDEISIWSRALSDKEVRSIYAAGIAGKAGD